VLTRLGATVIVIHHTNRAGEARGSSDFGPAGDQAFLVSNKDRNGGRLLDVITLNFQKSRHGHSGTITYHYAGGTMLRIEESGPATQKGEQFEELLRANPGILAESFEDMAQKRRLGRNKGRQFLKDGIENGVIRLEEDGRKRRHFWAGLENGSDQLQSEKGSIRHSWAADQRMQVRTSVQVTEE
jgi:hypothetical protein